MGGPVDGESEAESREETERRNYFTALPAELLVFVFSLLPTTRDKARLRYVSRRIRTVSETPSIWTEFQWPHYDTREQRCLNGILKACGGCIKQFCFPDYVAPSKLARMLQRCQNVTCLSMGTSLSATQLEKIVQNMRLLQKLEVHWRPYLINPLLTIAAKLQLVELTVYKHVINYGFTTGGTVHYTWMEEWVNLHCIPPNLNVVTKVCPVMVMCLVHEWPRWNLQIPAGHTASVKLYNSLKVTLNVSPPVPDFQLEFGQTATLPFVKASMFELSGFEKDLLLLTNSAHNGKIAHKVFTVSADEYFGFDSIVSISDSIHLNASCENLGFVTHFDASYFGLLSSEHLQQISGLCCHLQQLNLEYNPKCLQSLEGLRSIANCSPNLQGLNLLGIHAEDMEGRIELWKILSELKLTYLAVEWCMVNPCGEDDDYKQRLIWLLQKCSSLKTLECDHGYCDASMICRQDLCIYSLLLGHFPSLIHCILSGFCGTAINKVLASCKMLKYFKYSDTYSGMYPSAVNDNLQQLYIEAHYSDLNDDFTETVSVHGKLEYVVVSVDSVSAKGINALVKNSPKLITFHVYMVKPICNENGVHINPATLKTTLRKRFSNRRLFSISGGCKIVQGNEEYQKRDRLEEQTIDIFPLWSQAHY